MNYENEKKQFKVYFLVIALVASFSLGIFVEKRSGKDNLEIWGISEDDGFSKENLKLLGNVWDVLNKKYVGEIPGAEELTKGAARGIVGSLGDPYTVFWDENESKDFLQEMEGSFEGIGAEIGIRDRMLTVIAPLDGTPAERVGLKAGDGILKIDEELTTEMTLDEAIKKIRGPKGTVVKLTIFREQSNDGEPIEIEVTRSRINIKSVSWRQEGDDIAYIRINSFLKDTEQEFLEVFREVKNSGSKKIVLDLRNNPGGYLETAVGLAGYFIDSGSLVAREDYGKENKINNKDHLAKGRGDLKSYPLVILVNKGTASSAEILAGAIRDNRGVKLVGEETFGKGSVQEIASLEDGSSLKITVAKWLTPNGINIDKEGLEPDFTEEVKVNEAGEQDDRQLKKAIELLE